jgi:protein SCO1/2
MWKQIWHAACAVLLGAMIVGCAAARPTPTPAPEGVTVLEPPTKLADFTLTSSQNKPAHLSDWKGKAVLMSFGYTHCPDVCPVTLGRYKQVKEALGDSAGQVAFVFVSVDGARDTPAVLANYLGLFDKEFIGLTGDEPTLRTITKEYGATFSIEKKDPNQTDYTVAHTASWFLIDPKGNLSRVYAYDTQPEIAAADIKQVLSAKG